MTDVTALTGILILATLVESIVEYLIRPLVKPWIEGPDPKKPRLLAEEEKEVTWRDLVLRYVAASVAMALCAVYNADLLAMVGLVSPWPWVGWIVTGLIIGRGANFVHDFASRWLGAKIR